MANWTASKFTQVSTKLGSKLLPLVDTVQNSILRPSAKLKIWPRPHSTLTHHQYTCTKHWSKTTYGFLIESCKSTLHVSAQVLDNVWVLYGTQEATLLLKLSHDTRCSRGGKLKEGRVEDFSSTGEVITHGLADSSIWPNSKTFGFNEFDILIVRVILGLGLLSLVFKTCNWVTDTVIIS